MVIISHKSSEGIRVFCLFFLLLFFVEELERHNWLFEWERKEIRVHGNQAIHILPLIENLSQNMSCITEYSIELYSEQNHQKYIEMQEKEYRCELITCTKELQGNWN